MRGLLLFLIAACAAGTELPKAVFLEPLEKLNTAGAEVRDKMPMYRRVQDESKYRPWLENECATRALRLFARASRIASPGGNIPEYYIALLCSLNPTAA